MIIISLITIASFYYNFGDMWYNGLNHRIENIDSKINNHVLRELARGNMTEYYNEDNQKIADDTKGHGLIKRQYYENVGNNYSLIAVNYYGINGEIVKREFYRHGDVVHTNYICFPYSGGYLAL